MSCGPQSLVFRSYACPPARRRVAKALGLERLRPARALPDSVLRDSGAPGAGPAGAESIRPRTAKAAGRVGVRDACIFKSADAHLQERRAPREALPRACLPAPKRLATLESHPDTRLGCGSIASKVQYADGGVSERHHEQQRRPRHKAPRHDEVLHLLATSSFSFRLFTTPCPSPLA